MADDFDAIFNSPAPAGGQARDEYDDLFARPRNTAPVELKVIEDVTKPPEQAVSTLKATRQLGEPYGLGTPETVARAKAQTALKTIRENPFVQDYIEGNPAAAQASGDDWENLNAFSKAWQVLNAPDPMGRLATALGAQALGTGVRKGFLAERQGLAYIAGDREGAARFEREIAALPTAGSGIPYYAELVGSMIGQLGLDLGTGGLAGGAAGSVVPAVGTAFGVAGGTAAVNSNAAMGRFLMNLDKASAETGRPIDEATRFGTAAAFGAINTGANMIGIKSAAGAATELLAEAAARAAVQPGVGAAVGRMVTQVGKGGAVGGGLMSTMAATEAILADAAKASAGQEQTIFTDPARREEVVGQVTQAFVDGFLLMGGLHALPAGRNFVNDLRLTREAAAGKEALQGLMDTRESSATWQRMPELMAEYGRLHGDNTVTVTGAGVAALPEGLGMTMPDGARVVSLAEYAAAVPMDLHRAIADDIQHGPDAISVNEAKEVSGRWAAPRVEEQAAVAEVGSGVANTERANATPEATTPPTAAALTSTVTDNPIAAQAIADMDGMYLQPLFPDAAAVGMTEGEFGRYSKLLEGRAKAIQARNQRAAARDAAAELTPTYKAREELVREEATRNVDDRPVIVAERMARTGESADGGGSGGFKLDREVVDAVSRPGTSDLLRGLVKRGGMHPDELAELVGYGSGAELVQDLVAMRVERDRLGLSPAKYREKLIGEETRLRMEERFGLLPEEIEARAREAAVMPATTEILNAEREFLAAKAGASAGASLGEMRQAVATEFAGLPAKQARDLRAYMRAVTRAGREAELALLRQDFAKAFDAKQRQQVAHLFAEQAKAFGKMERKAGNILRQYSDNVTLPAVAQGYVNQIQGIARILGIDVRRNEADLYEVLGGAADMSLSRFIDAKNAELGGLIPDAPLPQKLLGDFTVADTAQLHDLLQALDFQGRAEKKIEIDGQQRELAAVVGEGVANLEALPDRFDPNKAGMKAVLDKFLRMADAPLLKMEQLFEWFDHHDTEGVFHRMVVKPLHAAQGLRDDMFVSLGKQLRALDQGKDWNRKLNDEVPNQTLLDPFDPANPRPMRFTRKNLLGLMLNMGNEGNFQVLTKGYSWEPGAVVDFVNRNATAKDWAWVQGIWDTFGSLEPQVKATYRELAGVAPDMVVPNEIVTPHGTFRGGYFPLIKDVLRNNERAENLEANLFARGQIQPLPANGYTKSRTGITYPLELNPDLVPAYLRATAHDIAFRGVVIRANKFLNSPEIQLAVKRTFGPEYAREFFPYLRDIANDGVSDVAGISYLNRMIAGARNRTIAALIGLNPGTVMIHGGSAAFNSIGELAHQFGWKRAIASTPKFVGTALGEVAADAIRVGQKATDGLFMMGAKPAAKVLPREVNEMVGRAYQSTIGRLTRSPVEFNRLWNEAIEQSPEMRHRMHNFDRDLNEQQNRALGKRDLAGVWNNFATGFVAYSDLLTAVPTFITARDLALANGHTLADAIDIGQKTVRQAHGSAGIVDRARIQRGSEFQKTFTMFYGYFSHNYNRNRNTWREAMEGKRQLSEREIRAFGSTALKVTTGAIFYALLPSLNHAWVRHPRDEKDSWTKWMAGALTTQFAGDIPFARDIITPVVSGYKAQISPLAASADVLATTARNALIVSGLRDEKLKHGAIRDAIHAGGIVLGAGTRQIGTSTEFIYDVSKNKEHPQGFGDWWRGLTTGHAKERKHH